MESFNELEIINRAAIILKPKQSFLDWVNSVGEDTLTFEDLDEDIYLVPDFEHAEEVNEWFSENYDMVFCNQMNSWNADTETWVRERTLEMFYEFFDVNYVSMVWDTEPEEVQKD